MDDIVLHGRAHVSASALGPFYGRFSCSRQRVFVSASSQALLVELLLARLAVTTSGNQLTESA